MSGLENSNGSIRSRIVLLLSSKLSVLRKPKLRLGLAGVAALAAVPVAALAAKNFSAVSDTNANLNSQPASETSSAQTEATLNANAQIPSPEVPPALPGGNQNQSNTKVTVNGQSVPVPENGSVHKTIDTGNGQVTTINAETRMSTPGNSYTNVQSFSSSTSSSVNVNQNTNIGGTSQ